MKFFTFSKTFNCIYEGNAEKRVSIFIFFLLGSVIWLNFYLNAFYTDKIYYCPVKNTNISPAGY